MSKEMIQTGKPLGIGEMVTLTGKDALYEVGGHKARIMNYSEGQLTEVDDVVAQDGYLWGIKKLKEPKATYDSIAFIAVR
jgi:hypothetical protein